MSPRPQQQEEEKSGIQIDKKDPYRGFRLQIKGFSGLNTAISPQAIDDTECQQLWNYVPVGKDVIRAAQGPLSFSTLAANIQAFFNDVIGTSLVMFVILADGSAGTVSATGLYTQAVGAPAGTFNTTGKQIDIQNWLNTYFLITDSVKGKGYFSFDGTNVVLISKSLNGNTLSIWLGRVLLAQGRTLNYSGALDAFFGVGTPPSWESNEATALYSTWALPSNSTGFYYLCNAASGNTGSSEPSWNATLGGTTSDGAIFVPAWQANQAYPYEPTISHLLNKFIQPVTPNGYFYTPVQAMGGISGNTEPSPWNTTIGGQTTDNTVTWLTCSTPTGWVANTAYVVGDVINPSNGFWYLCITPGTSGTAEPNFYPGAGNTSDNTVTWFTMQSSVTGNVIWETVTPGATQWKGSTAYVDGDLVYPIGGNGFWYLCTAPGNSGSAPPVFPTTPGTTVVDSGVTWTCVSLPVNSTSAGTFDITSTDLRQQIMKIIPYMDSIYVIGDHAIIALTGTTISNDPTNWYQMEVFNTLGTTSGMTCVNFQNNIYLENEYGMYRVASTQDVKIDAMLNDALFSFVNSRGDVGQINNLNFYLIPAYGFSPVSQAMRYFIIAYCIELQRFCFLDFGFDINGIFTTRSINDHSIYAWSGATIYKLFQGNGNVTRMIVGKQFGLDAPRVIKFIRKIALNYTINNGIKPVFTVTVAIADQNV